MPRTRRSKRNSTKVHSKTISKNSAKSKTMRNKTSRKSKNRFFGIF
jgi:hypothetical protein